MRGSKCIIYEVIIHSFIIDKMKNSDQLNRAILSYIVRKFNIFIKEKFQIFFKEIKILPNKKYKGLKFKPEKFIINYEMIKNKGNLSEEKTKENIKLEKKEKKISQKIEIVKKEINFSKAIRKNANGDSEMLIKFDLKKFDDIKMSEIDLQISHFEFKLSLIDYDINEYDPVYFKFDFEIDPERCRAEFNKEKKYLKVFLIKV
jgi:hypothetical protein